MAKHRKRSRLRSSVALGGGTGLAAAAVGVTSVTTAIVTGTTPAIAPSVDLMALVSAANSTSQFFAGSSYYGTDWTDVYGEQEVVPFFRGPNGLAEAITGAQDDNEQTGVTASGWGAGQTGTALGLLAENDPDVLDSIGLVILDNNSNRAGGGFWTTYSAFAPLLGTSADPTPSDLPITMRVLDVAYEYNFNSDAPVDPLNPFSIGNTLAAYAFGYGAESRALKINQATEGAPLYYEDPEGNTTLLVAGTHYVVDSDGDITPTTTPGALKDANGDPVTTIYVTVDSGNLPLTRLLRLLPGGDILANALDPTLTDLVDAGYADGKGLPTDPAIPLNPAITRPMKPFSSLSALDADGLQDSVQEGASVGAQTAISDITNPANLITKPIGEIGKLPFLSSLPSTLNNSTVNTANNQQGLTVLKKPAGITSSAGSDRPRPLKKAADDFTSSLKKFAGGLREQNNEDTDDDPE